MTASLKSQVSRLVRDNIGLRESIAIFAALEVAEQHWSDHDTRSYGTVTKDIVLGNAEINAQEI